MQIAILDPFAGISGDMLLGALVDSGLDPEWLQPGRYLIEIRTAEKIHFPLRRYVLEVR